MRIVFLLILCFSFSLAAQQKGSLIINFDIAESKEGTIYIALYNAEKDYLIQEYKGAVVLIEENNTKVTFDNLLYGDYAISCFHDENGNGILDKNALGIPKETYAFSNNAKGHFGPPKFEKAKVVLSSMAMDITIKL